MKRLCDSILYNIVILTIWYIEALIYYIIINMILIQNRLQYKVSKNQLLYPLPISLIVSVHNVYPKLTGKKNVM